VTGIHYPHCNAACTGDGHWFCDYNKNAPHAHGPEMDSECAICTDKR
jgi:hypothetical protein